MSMIQPMLHGASMAWMNW